MVVVLFDHIELSLHAYVSHAWIFIAACNSLMHIHTLYIVIIMHFGHVGTFVFDKVVRFISSTCVLHLQPL